MSDEYHLKSYLNHYIYIYNLHILLLTTTAGAAFSAAIMQKLGSDVRYVKTI